MSHAGNATLSHGVRGAARSSAHFHLARCNTPWAATQRAPQANAHLGALVISTTAAHVECAKQVKTLEAEFAPSSRYI